MSLPKHIPKEEKGLAKSFSQQLGISLDLKTGRDFHWNTFEGKYLQPLMLMDNGRKLIASHGLQISVWSVSEFRQIKEIEVPQILSAVKKNEEEFFAVSWETIFCVNISAGTVSKVFLQTSNFHHSLQWSASAKLLAYSTQKTLCILDQFLSVKQEFHVSDFKKEAYFTDLHFSKEGNVLGFGLLEFEQKRRFMTITLLNTINFEPLTQYEIDDCYRFCALQYPSHLAYTNDKSLMKYNLKNGQPTLLSGTYNKLNDEILYSGDHLLINNIGKEKLELWDMEKYEMTGERFAKTLHRDMALDGDAVILSKKDADSNFSLELFTEDFSKEKSIDILRHQKELFWYDADHQRLCYYDMTFDLNSGDFFMENDERIKLNLKNLPEGDSVNEKYVCCLLDEGFAGHALMFSAIDGSGKKIFSPAKSLRVADNSIDFYSYNKKQDNYLIGGEHFVAIYNPNDESETRSFSHREAVIGNFVLSDDQNHGLFVSKGFLHVLDMNSGIITAEYELQIQYQKERWVIDKTADFAKAFFLPQNDKLVIIEAIRTKESSSLKLSECALNLAVIRSVNIPMEIYDDDYDSYMNSFKFIEMNHAKTQFVFSYDSKTMLFDVADFSYVTLGISDVYDESYQRKAVFSDKDNYLIIEGSTNSHHFDLTSNKPMQTFSIPGKVPDGDDYRPKEFRQKYIFDEENDLIIVGRNHKTSFYRISDNTFLADLFLDSRAKFFLKCTPDASSSHAWFWTNVPDTVNVIKTKIDGSDPELLSIQDHARQSFMRYHNNKEVVFNRIFDQRKYSEFLKNTNRAVIDAGADLAIERSEIERKGLRS
jgi:hypothetical protein